MKKNKKKKTLEKMKNVDLIQKRYRLSTNKIVMVFLYKLKKKRKNKGA